MSWNTTSAGPAAMTGGLKRGVGAAIVLSAASMLLLAAGFFWFVGRLPTQEIAVPRAADGIVVLTGGASRIEDAVELLAAGRGKRLLISGVHPGTTTGEIGRTLPEYANLLACCVDLDHSARNTLGNAIETRRWVRDRGFRSLIVVTSSYHIPRTMMALGWQMPEVDLIPFPVVPRRNQGEPWWTTTSPKLLLTEYLKYIAVWVRTKIDPAPNSTAVAR